MSRNEHGWQHERQQERNDKRKGETERKRRKRSFMVALFCRTRGGTPQEKGKENATRRPGEVERHHVRLQRTTWLWPSFSPLCVSPTLTGSIRPGTWTWQQRESGKTKKGKARDKRGPSTGIPRIPRIQDAGPDKMDSAFHPSCFLSSSLFRRPCHSVVGGTKEYLSQNFKAILSR